MARSLHRQLLQIFPDTTVRLEKTKHAGHAEELAYKAASSKKKRTLIISVSGDGGYNEVINGALKAAEDHSTNPVCAVAPGGNANDHFRNTSSRPLLEAIQADSTQDLDILEISYRDKRRYAHSYIGIGITPNIAIELNKHSLSLIKEAWLALKTFLGTEPVTIQQKGTPRSYDSILVSTVRSMAKYLTLSRSPSPNDGFLRVLRWSHKSRLHLAGYVLRSAIGLPLKSRRMRSFEFRTVHNLPAQLDGEVINLPANTPVVIRVVPKKLRTVL